METAIIIIGVWATAVGFLLLVLAGAKRQGEQVDAIAEEVRLEYRDDLNYFRRRVRKLELDLAFAREAQRAALAAQHRAEERRR